MFIQNINQESIFQGMGCLHVKGEAIKSSKMDLQALESTILTTKAAKQHMIKLLKERLEISNNNFLKIKLIIRGSQSGFTAKRFHQLSDGQSNTLLLVRTNQNKILGGYTPCSWKNSVLYQFEVDGSKKSFLFSLSRKDKSDKNTAWEHKLFGLIEKQNAIQNCEDQGPIFGAGHDLHLTDQCNKNQNWANMGKSYASQFKFGSNKANEELAGEIRFIVDQYQLWGLEFESQPRVQRKRQ